MVKSLSNAVERAATSPERIAVLTQIYRDNRANSSRSQRERLTEALCRMGAVTTIEARKYLDVMSPAPRIMELRRAGRPIKTLWVNQATDSGKMHRVGLYVLEAKE